MTNKPDKLSDDWILTDRDVRYIEHHTHGELNETDVPSALLFKIFSKDTPQEAEFRNKLRFFMHKISAIRNGRLRDGGSERYGLPGKTRRIHDIEVDAKVHFKIGPHPVNVDVVIWQLAKYMGCGCADMVEKFDNIAIGEDYESWRFDETGPGIASPA